MQLEWANVSKSHTQVSTSQINHVGHVYYMYTLIFGLGGLRFRWVGGRCAQVSPLTLGVYTTIGVLTIFGTGRPLVTP
eukprot:SAG22_NODE_4162_length_1362_cov_8.121140_1_plen_78_part_00